MSGKCTEEQIIRGNVVEKPCYTRNLAPLCIAQIQTSNDQVKIDQSTSSQPMHLYNNLPKDNVLIKDNTTAELYSYDFSKLSSNLVPSENEPSSSVNHDKQPAKFCDSEHCDYKILGHYEGIAIDPQNDLSSDDTATYENEESSTGDSTNTAKIFTFPTITQPNVEDISANCCNLDLDALAEDTNLNKDYLNKKIDSPNLISFQTSSTYTPSVTTSLAQTKVSITERSNTSKVILNPSANPTLPAVVIHSSDCDSSPTLICDKKPITKKNKNDLKTAKKKEALHSTIRSNVSYSAQADDVDSHLHNNLENTSHSSKFSSKQHIIPLLNIPSDDEYEKSQEKAEKEEYTSQKQRNEIAGQHPKVPEPIQIPNLKQKFGDSLDSPRIKKRRKSLVDLIFSKEHSSFSPPPSETPPIIISANSGNSDIKSSCEDRLAPSPASSRLKLRRLSDIVPWKKKTKYSSCEQSSIKDDICINEAESARTSEIRRSSVTIVDDTDRLKMTKGMLMHEERRRMSSFPPSDGDEASIMLQKIHDISNVKQEDSNDGNDAAINSLKASESKPTPFRFLNLLSVNKKFAKISKSSLDIPSQLQFADPQTSVDSEISEQKYTDHGDSNRSNMMHTPLSVQQHQTHLIPNNQLSQRRCSSPLIIGLEVMRKEGDDFHVQGDTQTNLPGISKYDKSGSITSLPQYSTSLQGKKSLIERPGIVVFPKRKLEDVPGIFIPNQKAKPSMSFFSSVPVSTSAATPTRAMPHPSHHSLSGPYDNILRKNLLTVTREGSERRRHSISMFESLLVEKQFAAVKSSFPPLLPRSPYADTTNINISFLDDRYGRCTLIKTFLKQKV